MRDSLELANLNLAIPVGRSACANRVSRSDAPINFTLIAFPRFLFV